MPSSDFVDGAVAAGRHHQVRAAVDVFARDGARGAGPGGGGHRHVVAVLRQDFDGPLDQRAAFPSEFARAGIVDQDGVPVGCDGVFSGFLVRL